jgi:hypothetical protein
MTLTTLITVNAVLAAIVLYGIALLLAHGVRHDRWHSLGHTRSLRVAAPARERDRIAA